MSKRELLETGEEIIWVITTDKIGDGERNGFSNASKEEQELYKDLLKHRFMLYDDDSELYYYGTSTNQECECAFEPLDWAMSNDGCTEIKYQNQDTKKFETL